VADTLIFTLIQPLTPFFFLSFLSSLHSLSLVHPRQQSRPPATLAPKPLHEALPQGIVPLLPNYFKNTPLIWPRFEGYPQLGFILILFGNLHL
jgi:hypothetical protein